MDNKIDIKKKIGDLSIKEKEIIFSSLKTLVQTYTPSPSGMGVTMDERQHNIDNHIERWLNSI